jgi:hypothetical protein
MAIIDLSPQLHAIKDRHPEWWQSEQARRELAALWGYADGDDGCNDCGVQASGETIRIELDSQWRGEIHIAVAPNGWHAMATSYWYSLGGGGSSPSVWNRTAYTTRDEALAAGIDKLIATFEGLRDAKGWIPDSQRVNAQRMIDKLREHLSQSRQMSLF